MNKDKPFGERLKAKAAELGFVACGIARADALVVPVLEGQGRRPTPNDATCVGLERGVHGVDPNLGARNGT